MCIDHCCRFAFIVRGLMPLFIFAANTVTARRRAKRYVARLVGLGVVGGVVARPSGVGVEAPLANTEHDAI